MSRKLVLFDVDGTLITETKVHGEAFSEAFKKVFGIDADINEITHPGKTDKGIIMEMMKMKGVDEKTILSEIGHAFSVMSKYVEDNVRRDNSFHEIPHVRELIAILEKKQDNLGLITGNVEKIARLKLEKLGLYDFFETGGFGNLSEKRSELIIMAIRKAEEKYKRKIEKKDVFVIGDTPRDIEAGKSAGVSIISVATGPYALSELKKHNPDFAFADFSNPDKIVQAIHSD